MHRTIAPPAVLLLGCMLAAAPLSAQGLPGVQFSIDTKSDQLEVRHEPTPEQKRITHLRLAGAANYEQAGLPRIPYFFRWVALPPGSKVTRVQSQGSSSAGHQGVELLSWGQPHQPGREPTPPWFPQDGKDIVYYAATETVGPSPLLKGVQVWPPQTASLVSIDDRDGIPVAKVAVFPVQWFPQNASLIHHQKVDVLVEIEGGRPFQPRKDYLQAMTLEELRGLVVNPELIPEIAIPILPEELDAWHLIITDDFNWNAQTITRGSSLGDLVSEFQRLSDWKTRKGVLSAVVTVTDIVDGRYGDFRTGARDLQEVLRNFLKHARSEFHTYWVLLGGDIDVIPARTVLGNVWGGGHHFHLHSDKPQPDKGGCWWDAAQSTVRVHRNNKVEPTSKFFSQKTGRTFSRVASPSVGTPGWAYATNDGYSTVSASTTEYVIIRGPAADLADTNVYIDHYENSIPTDLYYADLQGPAYNAPGLHDWDKNDNGVYGQADWVNQIDGVNFYADVALGRAPVGSPAEARAFVDKVIAYERYDDLPADFARKLLIGSANWGGGPAVSPDASNPPPEDRYFSAPGFTDARLHFRGPPNPDVPWKLVAYDAVGDWWEVPYDRNASATSLGWHYVTDETYSTVSEIYFDLGLFGMWEIPIPTAFVRVKGPSAQVRPAKYFFDDSRPDGSVVEKEEIRSLLSTKAPDWNLKKRLYQDLADTPGYPDPDLFELSETAMRAELDAGYNIVSLSGHGYWGGCCGVDARYVDELINGKKGGLVYADSCLTGEFNKEDAVAEVFLKSAIGGAAAYIGNSRFSWIGNGHVLEKAFWNRVQTDRHVGRLHNTKSMHLEGWAEAWTNYALTLFGDPEMPLWRKSPAPMVVTHPARVTLGDRFVVRVTNTGGVPITFARVCLTGPRGIFELHYTGVTGETEFSTTDKQAGDVLSITVTKEDYLPYEGTVEVRGRLSTFVRADANLDLVLDISDALTIFGVLFQGQGKLPCPDAADANDDGAIDISDGIKVLGFLFLGDKLPPGTIVGKPQEDTTPDNLDC